MDDPSDATTKQRTNPAEPRARYEQDLYGWAVEQAELLRAGRVTEADTKNIAEELDDAGNEQYDKLESALRLILTHLLKWDHQRGRRSPSWRSTILVQRKHVAKVLRKNPGLKPLVGEAVHEAYDLARIEAAGETDLDEEAFPRECPYSFSEIMERPITWPPLE
jgi:Domain of unknown function DUF29